MLLFISSLQACIFGNVLMSLVPILCDAVNTCKFFWWGGMATLFITIMLLQYLVLFWCKNIIVCLWDCSFNCLKRLSCIWIKWLLEGGKFWREVLCNALTQRQSLLAGWTGRHKKFGNMVKSFFFLVVLRECLESVKCPSHESLTQHSRKMQNLTVVGLEVWGELILPVWKCGMNYSTLS